MSIDQGSFDYVRQLVRERSAIVLDEGKQYLVDSRLYSLARTEGLSDAQEVIDRLRACPMGPLQRKVVEAMTTTETLFFRDVKPYDALREVVLPELHRQRASERRLHVWSCACSSGQEPYSLAMLLREHFPLLAAWDVRITATDISTEMLARAQTGRYSQLEVNRGLPAHLLVKYFERRGMDWHVRDELRRLIVFRELNLAGPWAAMAQADVVMLRNVLIYFDVETKRRILARVRQVMRPDGYLFLGTAESTMNLDDGYEIVRAAGATFYRVRAR